jgi:hypothetical protein
MNKPKDTHKIIVQMQPIEFNELIGNQPPTREEVARAYIQLLKDNKFWYSEIIQHTKGEYTEGINTPND